MSNYYLREGLEFNLSNQNYFIHSKLESGWQVENESTGRIVFYEEAQLLEEFLKGNLRPKSANAPAIRSKKNGLIVDQILADVDPWSRHVISVRLTFIKYFTSNFSGHLTQKYIQIALDDFWVSKDMGKIPSVSSAYRWIRSYMDSGEDIMALLPRNAMRGSRTKRLNKETIDFCLTIIHAKYLNTNRITVAELMEDIKTGIYYENKMRAPSKQHAVPSKSTITRLIEEIGAYEVYKGRYGKVKADLRFCVVKDQTPALHIHARWEIDHTPMDVIALDDIYGKPIGRPILTTIVDVKTRMIIAAYVSFEFTSAIRVMNTLKQAILPKHEILKQFPKIENDWPCYGLPDEVFSDRGAEFMGELFHSFCQAMNIGVAKGRKLHGNDKGTIERTAGVINYMVTSQMKGKTFQSIPLKTFGYNPQKDAVLSLHAIKEAVYRNVCDVYHQSFHSTLGKSPIEKWKEEVGNVTLRLPSSIEYLEANIAIADTRKLTNHGIELHNLAYSSRDLEKLVHQIGYVEVGIRWNPDDLGHILVNLKAGGFLKVPLNKVYFDYGNGISLKHHKAIRKDMPKGDSAEKALYLALKKEEIRKDALDKAKSARISLSKKDQQLIEGLDKKRAKTEIKVSATLNDFYPDDDVPDLGVF
jgi:putative transposase